MPSKPHAAGIVIGTRYVINNNLNVWMTLLKGVVFGLSGISCGVSFRLSQRNWYRKLPKQLQKVNEPVSSLMVPINDDLSSGENSHKALEIEHVCFLGRISCFTANFPLCTGNMEAFGFQIQSRCQELVQTRLAFTGRYISAMQSTSAGSITSGSCVGVNALALGGAGRCFLDLDESALEKFAINTGTGKWCPHRE